MTEHPLLSAWRATCAAEPALRRLIDRVLDRRDREGSFPRTLRHRAQGAEFERLVTVLPPAALTRHEHAITLRLDLLERLLIDECEALGAVPLVLETLFDTLAGRSPRDRRAEARASIEALEQVLREGARLGRARAGKPLRALGHGPGDDPAIAAFIATTLDEATRDVGPFAALARSDGPAAAATAFETLVAGLALARHPRLGGRSDDLSRWVAGHTKTLRPNSPDHARLCDTLLAIDPELAAAVEAERPGSRALRRRFTLEHCGFVGNTASLDVLLQGPLELKIGAETLGDPARLAREGLPAKLPLSTLRRASRITTAASEVLTVENESAFHALAARRAPSTLLVYTGGQAGWAVVLLLRALAAGAPELGFAHTGDLDRAGLEIWRSLAHRARLAITPRWMDATTHARCLPAGLPLRQAEEARILRVLATWSEPHGRDLLEALLETGRWVEQESVLATLDSA